MILNDLILTCIGLGVSIIAYYLKENLKDMKNNQTLTTSLENRLALIEQKSTNDLKHLSEITNNKLELVQKDVEHMSLNLKQYMGNVNKLFEISNQNTINIDNLVKMCEKHEAKFEKYDENILDFFTKYDLHEKNV